ncbi:MAG: helix-hairpin-helix domain-containing protein [Lachnospiraceae bacterium]|nr:helix-hairpin-helix domain-containing protein [Lachnospiraceae bacterium]
MAFEGFGLSGCTSKAELVSEASSGTVILDETCTEVSTEETDEKEETAEPGSVFVHVCGAVSRPGLYELPAGSRVSAAVEAAGGFARDADRDYINLAAVLADGVKLDIPTEEESSEMLKQSMSSSSGDIAGAFGSESAGIGIVTPDNGQAPVNLNTAGAEELQSISGIGPSKAEAVVRYREEHGPFTDTSEIMNVSGIGTSTYEKIKDRITV